MPQSFWSSLRDYVWVPAAPAQTQTQTQSQTQSGSAGAAAEPATTARLAWLIWDAEGRPDGRANNHWQAALTLQSALGPAAAAALDISSDVERLQFESDLAEVQLLLDFISGRPDQTFAWQAPQGAQATALPNADDPAEILRSIASGKITVAELVRVGNIRFPPDKSVAGNALDALLLIALRDKLNRSVAPASGLTVAFTLRTWALLGTLFKPDRFTRHWARWKLADKAFPSLTMSVVWYITTAFAIFFGGLLITVFTLGISYDVTAGQGLLNRINALDQQQTAVMSLIAQVEAAAAPPNMVKGPGNSSMVVRYCQKAQLDPLANSGGVAVQEFDSAQQYETCDKLQTVTRQLTSEYAQLTDWYHRLQQRCKHSWVVALGLHLSSAVTSCDLNAAFDPPEIQPDGSVAATASFFRVADLITDCTNVLLPVLYGLIGSVVAALRSIVGKVSASTLAPWDAGLMWTRLLLGSMAGACIGLFFSPAGTDLQGSPGMGTLSLSAVAFLAGYAVDGLFSLLDEIIQRLFRLKPDTTPQSRA